MEKTKLRKRIDVADSFEFLLEPHRYKVAWGGRGGGRSWAYARELLRRTCTEKLLILCAREFQKSIRDSVHRLLSNQIDLLGFGREFYITRQSIVSRAGSEFIFEGLKENVTKIKSLEGVDIAWVEEAEKVSSDSWDILIPTIRKNGSEIWVTFNPDLETDPTYKRFILENPPGAYVTKTSWRDLPEGWFPEELVKEKDYMWRVDSERASWIWDGECRSHSDAQILKGKWMVDAFEVPLDKKGNPLWYGPYYGADWGFAISPTALIRFWIAPLGNGLTNLMIEYEAYGVGVDICDTPELFDQVPGSRVYPIYADCARPETINHMCNAGFRVYPAPKWPGSVEDGVTWLRGHNKIIIHDRCKHTKDDARNYSFKVDPLTGDILPIIIKKWDDTWDSVRYGASSLIQQDSGDEILIYDDPVVISTI